MTVPKPFKRIITTDPHSYNTIKNEYPSFGAVAPISHYSTLLADLLASGRLKVQKPLNKRVTFHDPCHLGRLNGELRCTAARARVDRLRTHRDAAKSRQLILLWCWRWTHLDPRYVGTQKPSENRVHEAASLGGIDIFVTCCPKDLSDV